MLLAVFGPCPLSDPPLHQMDTLFPLSKASGRSLCWGLWGLFVTFFRAAFDTIQSFPNLDVELRQGQTVSFTQVRQTVNRPP
jgi:hypothetical protein